MRLASINHNNHLEVAVVVGDNVFPISQVIEHYDLLDRYNTDMKSLIETSLQELVSWYNSASPDFEELTPVPLDLVEFAPLYPNPDKIWSIGLNYTEHASDLDEGTPDTYPGSFMRPTTTIIGDGSNIELPPLSERTTGEGELAIIIGKEAKNISRNNWLDVVAGFTTIIDMTAEDILRLNPRYLTLAKAFDTYYSFGPIMITADEFSTQDIMDLEVSTIHNGEIHASNVVSNMRYPPDYLVSFHSQVMTLLPGDIISTGTPRAKHIEAGDRIGCNITGFHPIENPVTRPKSQ